MFNKGCGSIAVHVCGDDVRLLQLSRDHNRVIDAARGEIPAGDDRPAAIAEAIRGARNGRRFRGRKAVICLGAEQLHLQNVRIPKGERVDTATLVVQEAASRIPFPVEEVELRHLDAADVRVSDNMLREIIVIACHKPRMEDLLSAAEQGGLNPIAVETEPGALLRNLNRQFRRGEDRQGRVLIVHIGPTATAVMIAQDTQPLFVKYTALGGESLNQVVAKRLDVSAQRAAQLRRSADDDLAETIHESTRSLMEQLAAELELCVRYHSVTFRGRPLERLLLCGPEASAGLLDSLAARLELPGALSDPFARIADAPHAVCGGQWDVATGLAQHEATAP
jgi:type IV pilus assembly protein PilM